jgi:hypothetical protein
MPAIAESSRNRGPFIGTVNKIERSSGCTTSPTMFHSPQAVSEAKQNLIIALQLCATPYSVATRQPRLS